MILSRCGRDADGAHQNLLGEMSGAAADKMEGMTLVQRWKAGTTHGLQNPK